MCIHSSDNRLSREKKITMMCMMKKLHKVKEQLETDQIEPACNYLQVYSIIML